MEPSNADGSNPRFSMADSPLDVDAAERRADESIAQPQSESPGNTSGRHRLPDLSPHRRRAAAESTIARLPHEAAIALLAAGESRAPGFSFQALSGATLPPLVDAGGHLTELGQVTQQSLRSKVHAERQRLQQALTTRNVDERLQREASQETHRLAHRHPARDRDRPDLTRRREGPELDFGAPC
jgi:hypothetical protein